MGAESCWGLLRRCEAIISASRTWTSFPQTYKEYFILGGVSRRIENKVA